MQIIDVKKTEKTMSTADVIKIFNSTDDLEKIKEAVSKAKERIYLSWASVEAKDKAGEVIPIKDLEKQQASYMKRGGDIMDNHTNRKIGNTLSYKVLIHPKTRTKGILHINRIFDDGNQIDNKAWQEIKSGKRKGSSVGGYNTENKLGRLTETGEKVKVLEGFAHMETSSVYEPCNPFALNEAHSAVAKSAENVTKPAKLDRCVQELMNDPDFKPRGDETKEQAAYAVCQAAITKSEYPEMMEKSANVINKLKNNDTYKQNTQKGDNNMTEEIMKSLKEIQESIKANSEAIKSLQDSKKAKKKAEDYDDEDGKVPGEQDTDPDEKKKQEEDEEDKKPEEDMEEKKKEDAKGKIEGESDASQPEDPSNEDSNDKEVYKQVETRLKSEIEELKKSIKEVAAAQRPAPKPVNKAVEKIGQLPLDIALGKVHEPWNDTIKSYNQLKKEAM